MGKPEDDDATVRIRQPAASSRPRWLYPVFLLSAGFVAAFGGAAFWYVTSMAPPTAVTIAMRPANVPSEPATSIRPPEPVPPPLEFAIRTASEAEILANREGPLAIFRFASNPNVLVLDFDRLSDQAAMLNRMAAFTEKAGLPRDRVLDDAELDAAIRVRGDQPDSYYYGHDYSAASFVTFFATADRQKLVLNASEQRLRRLLEQEGLLRPGILAAVVSIPRAEPGSAIDDSSRATILRHELSHGEFFSSPAYVAYVRSFWDNIMSRTERDAFTRFLAADSYDTSQPELIINETQAYLMHTPDTRFFSAQTVGLPLSSLDRLRAAFLLNMPQGWLRDCTGVPLPIPAATRPGPTAADRRSPRQRSTVVTRRACPDRRTPRARAESSAALSARM